MPRPTPKPRVMPFAQPSKRSAHPGLKVWINPESKTRKQLPPLFARRVADLKIEKIGISQCSGQTPNFPHQNLKDRLLNSPRVSLHSAIAWAGYRHRQPRLLNGRCVPTSLVFVLSEIKKRRYEREPAFLNSIPAWSRKCQRFLNNPEPLSRDFENTFGISMLD